MWTHLWTKPFQWNFLKPQSLIRLEKAFTLASPKAASKNGIVNGTKTKPHRALECASDSHRDFHAEFLSRFLSVCIDWPLWCSYISQFPAQSKPSSSSTICLCGKSSSSTNIFHHLLFTPSSVFFFACWSHVLVLSHVFTPLLLQWHSEERHNQHQHSAHLAQLIHNSPSTTNTNQHTSLD